jgi:hypothetical protein
MPWPARALIDASIGDPSMRSIEIRYPSAVIMAMTRANPLLRFRFGGARNGRAISSVKTWRVGREAGIACGKVVEAAVTASAPTANALRKSG